MSENYYDTHENEKWCVALLMLLYHDYTLYAEFKYDLLHKNRYIPTKKISDFLKLLKKYTNTAIISMPKHSTLYRARVADAEYHEKIVKEFCDKVLSFEVEDKELRTFLASPSIFNTLAMNLLPVLDKKPDVIEKATKFFQDYLTDEFQGYEADQCLAAPPDKTLNGRVNPSNISYLYTAESLDTAIYEIKPIVGQQVSVATLRNKKELKLLDLSRDSYENTCVMDDGTENKSPTVIQPEFPKTHNDEVKQTGKTPNNRFKKSKINVAFSIVMCYNYTTHND